MKKLVALLLVLCLAFSSVAIAAAEEEPFVVNACIASEPETIDPSLISSVDGSTYTQHQFENLMKYVKTDEHPADDETVYNVDVDLGQAASYTVNDDQTVYTFTLRDDIFWSDGQPVVAADFVYSWQRLVNPETAADYGYFLDNIVLNAAAIQAGEKDPSELGLPAVSPPRGQESEACEGRPGPRGPPLGRPR